MQTTIPTTAATAATVPAPAPHRHRHRHGHWHRHPSCTCVGVGGLRDEAMGPHEGHERVLVDVVIPGVRSVTKEKPTQPTCTHGYFFSFRHQKKHTHTQRKQKTHTIKHTTNNNRVECDGYTTTTMYHQPFISSRSYSRSFVVVSQLLLSISPVGVDARVAHQEPFHVDVVRLVEDARRQSRHVVTTVALACAP